MNALYGERRRRREAERARRQAEQEKVHRAASVGATADASSARAAQTVVVPSGVPQQRHDPVAPQPSSVGAVASTQARLTPEAVAAAPAAQRGGHALSEVSHEESSASVPQQRASATDGSQAEQDQPGQGAPVHVAAPTADRTVRPLSRRELRERERRRAGAELSTPPNPAPGEAATVAGDHSGDHDHDLDPVEPRRYTWKHCVALGAVAGVLGLLVWSLTTEGDAGVAVSFDPATTLSAVPAAPRGES